MGQLSSFAAELRAEVAGNRIVGHAAVFGQFAELPGHLETLHRTAFDQVLKDSTTDVRALFNHDPNMVLGRQSSGTLKLSVDDEGLAFELDIPDTTYGRDLRELVARGDISGASFGFIPGADNWTRTKDGRQLRTHTSVSRLVDVSVVAFPAYTGAQVMLRSLPPVAPSGDSRSQLIRARHRALHLRRGE